MKKLFAISSVLFSLLSGGGCSSGITNLPSTTSTTAPIITSSPPLSIPSYPQIVSSGAFATPDNRQFSDPSADFTLEYPSTWEYTKDQGSGTHPELRSWRFNYNGQLALEANGHMADPRGFDGCWSNHILEEKKYPTNDPSTVVIEQICGLCVNEEDNTKGFEGTCEMQKTPYGANIYFIPGEKIKTLNTIWSLSEEKIKNLHLLILKSPFQYDRDTNQKHTDEEYAQFIDWARKIAGSIKIVKK